MARPENIEDIELDDVEFARVELNQISTQPALLKGYTAFLEAVVKGGAEVTENYNTVTFRRSPSYAEQVTQLKRAQERWEECKKQYDIMASVGEVEYNWQRSQAEEYATSEGLPWPPEVEPISDYHAVLRDIDSVTN